LIALVWPKSQLRNLPSHFAHRLYPPEDNESNRMDFLSKRTLKSLLLPGGILLLGAAILLNLPWLRLPAPGVNFFYYAVFVAAILLAWRFHSTRILLCAVILMLSHHGLSWYEGNHALGPTVAHVAFQAIALLIPIDFIFLTFFPERGYESSTVTYFLVLLFFESIFVAALARPDMPSGFLHLSFVSSYHWHLPQPALLALVAASALLIARIAQFHKAIDNGMLWSLIAVACGLESGASGKIGTAYFGVAGFILASSIIENSYSLAYQDELTGLSSRRAFNDALLRLKPPYAIAAVDIDHFKNINDTYGHDTGDQVLRLVAARLARVSGGGQAFRVGGEEFTILFPNRTQQDVVDHLELVRMEIEGSSFRVRSKKDRRKTPREADRRTAGARKKKTATAPGGSVLSVTVSIGIAESQSKFSVDEVIQQADQALYRAKEGGRNRVVLAVAKPKLLRRREAGTSAKS
jgi:diguanylate cyclase (GGDEF)-like protein